MKKETKMQKVEIAVANEKGGVGKTFISVILTKAINEYAGEKAYLEDRTKSKTGEYFYKNKKGYFLLIKIFLTFA
jgi:cellulose biosynthesis protein BcsQ